MNLMSDLLFICSKKNPPILYKPKKKDLKRFIRVLMEKFGCIIMLEYNF